MTFDFEEDKQVYKNPNNLLDISIEEEKLDEPESEFGPIEIGQKRIIVKYGELNFPVNWYEEQPLDDV